MPGLAGALLVRWRDPPGTHVALVAALFALAAGWSGPLLWWRQREYPPSWLGGELDTHLIIEGVDRARTLADTLAWWTGAWAGQVPFYRPLTSLLFWLERRAFGDREWLYLFPTVALHVAATVAFALLAWRLARRWDARHAGCAGLVAAWGFSDWLWPDSGRAAHLVWGHWKNQPDSAAAALGCLALLLYAGEVGADRRLPVRSAAAYLGACLFKESALPLVLLTPFLEVPRFARSARVRLTCIIGTCLLFVVWRHVCLGGPGYVYGSNRAAEERTLTHLLGPFAPLMLGFWLPAALAAVIAAALAMAGRRGAVPAALVAVIGAVAAVTADTWLRTGSGPLLWLPAVGVARMADPVVLLPTGLGLAWLLAAASLWRRRKEALGLCLGWSAVLILPLVFSPGPLHRYYLSQGGEILLYALGLAAGLPVRRRPTEGTE